MARDKNELISKTRGSRVIRFYDPRRLVVVVVSPSTARFCNAVCSTCTDWVICPSDCHRGNHHAFSDPVSPVLGVGSSLDADLHVQNSAG